MKINPKKHPPQKRPCFSQLKDQERGNLTRQNHNKTISSSLQEHYQRSNDEPRILPLQDYNEVPQHLCQDRLTDCQVRRRHAPPPGTNEVLATSPLRWCQRRPSGESGCSLSPSGNKAIHKAVSEDNTQEAKYSNPTHHK